MCLLHPLGATALLCSTIELKGRSDSDHHTLLQIGQKHVHKTFLFGCSQSHPDNLRPIYAFHIDWHPAAVANREHTPVDHFQVFRITVGCIHLHAIGHADIALLRRLNYSMYRLLVKLVVEKLCIHTLCTYFVSIDTVLTSSSQPKRIVVADPEIAEAKSLNCWA